MNTNNKVYNVLVATGTQAVAAKDSTLDNLAVGQIGVFDRATMLAIDGTERVRNFFIAVGADKSGNGTKDDLYTSAGQQIERANIRDYSFRPHTPGRPQIFTFGGYVYGKCDTEYGIRLEFQNQDVYNLQGFNQFSKYYSMNTGCCTGCESCPTGDANEITIGLVKSVNADLDKLVTAVIIARQNLVAATHGITADIAAGAVVPEAEALKLVTYNKGQTNVNNKVFTDIRFTTNALAIQTYCSINLNYKYPRFTKVEPAKVEGFDCEGTFTVTQTPAAEEGLGYDINQLEYNAGGWENNPGPYRTSEVVGVAFPIKYQATANLQYDLFTLSYDEFAEAGWGNYQHDLCTYIAIPSASTTTRNGFAAIIDRLVAPAGLDALADDAAAANVSPTAQEPTSGKTQATDGISQ
jgi:hypothetical protein